MLRKLGISLKHDNYHCIVGLVVASATAEHEVPGLIPGLGKVLLGLSIKHFSVAVTETGLCARLKAIGSSTFNETILMGSHACDS